MRRKGLFHYVASGSNVVRHVGKGSHVQSRVQLLSIADRQWQYSQSDSQIHNKLR